MGSEGVLKVIFERISTCFTLYILYTTYLYIYIYMKYAFLNIYHVNIEDTMFRRVKF